MRNIIPAILRSEHFRVTWLIGRDEKKLEKIAQVSEFESRVTSSLQEALEDPGLDSVYISTPNSMHDRQLIDCVKAGKHVLIEKPAVLSKTTVGELTEALLETEVSVMEAFMYRYHDQFAWLTELLQGKSVYDLGELCAASIRFGFPHRDVDTDIRYRYELSGGALNDAGAYTVNLCQHLAGGEELKIKSCNVSPASKEYEVDIRGGAHLASSNCDFFLSWGMGRKYQNEVDLWFSNGRVIIDRAFSKPIDIPVSVFIQVGDEPFQEKFFGPCDHFGRMLENFESSKSSPAYRDLLKTQLIGQHQLLVELANFT